MTIKEKFKNYKEDFFVSYAIRGPVRTPAYGIRGEIPFGCPIHGPVIHYDHINSQYLYYYPPYPQRVFRF